MTDRKHIRDSRGLSGRQGITLVEVLITVLIFTVVAAACYVALSSGSRSWQVNSAQLELQQELRKSVDRMSDDIRQSGAGSTIFNVPADSAWYSSAAFRQAAGASGGFIVWSTDTVQYRLDGTDGHELWRVSSDGTHRVIARNIVSLGVRRLSGSPKMVNVKLVAQISSASLGTLRDDIAFSVKVRN